ncbi:MAG: hypothetical protein ACXWP5_16480 [Bdellovibrionota bacterium]
MKRNEKSTAPSEAELALALEAAFQGAVERGWLVDTGRKRWSERIGRCEIVWESKIFGKTLQ